MARKLTQWRRWPVLLAIALAALMAGALAPAFAQGGPPAEPLVPNVEPEEAAGGLAGAQPVWVMSEEEAVRAALAAYEGSGALSADEASPLALPADAWSLASREVYLPLVARGVRVPLDPNQGDPVTPTPEPEPTPGKAASVDVTIWPKPSIIVGRGAILEYEIRLRNRGDGDARETKVVFPYNRSQVALAYTSLDTDAGDWVSAIGDTSFTVTFGELESDEARTGKVFVRVGNSLPNQTLLDVRARCTWRDAADGGDRRANWTPVLVGNGPSDAPYVWVGVDPDRGPLGTQHRFFSNRFLPYERVTTWLNVPGGGVRALDLAGTANAEGAIELRLRGTDPNPDLARGTYQIVLYGQRSGLTGVATFIVQ